MGEVTDAKIKELRRIARAVRIRVVGTVHHAGAGHLGGPLSAADLLTALYFEMMNIRPEDPHWKGRDRFVLSKGHSAVALYCVLAERGYFPIEELATFDQIDSRLQAHPDMNLLPGVDMSTGSLGQGLSAAVGMALGARRTGASFRTYCMIGDGESQEGQVWEAADIAVRYRLDNLTVILDCNRLQQFGWEGVDGRSGEIPAPDPAARWESFGFQAVHADGHDFASILGAFREAGAIRGKPAIIIARTVKGKGVGFMEHDRAWHSRVPTDRELALAISELQEGNER